MSNSKCPHCRVVVHFSIDHQPIGEDIDGQWFVAYATCPSCNRLVVYLSAGSRVDFNDLEGPFQPFAPYMGTGVPPTRPKLLGPYLVWPKHATFAPAADEVPPELAEDYNEARAILELSPKASAALARRCLQSLIRDHEGIHEKNLSDEIQKLLDKGELPSYLAENVDAIRQVGNFAAHPVKNQHSGAVTEVEPNEAEWILDVLEGLFDFYFVQREENRKRREALNQKRENAQKGPFEKQQVTGSKIGGGSDNRGEPSEAGTSNV